MFPRLFVVVRQHPSPGDLPDSCSLVPDLGTGSAAEPGRGILTCLLGCLPLASVSFGLYLAWLPTYQASRRLHCVDHLPCSVGPASWEVAALVMVPGHSV